MNAFKTKKIAELRNARLALMGLKKTDTFQALTLIEMQLAILGAE